MKTYKTQLERLRLVKEKTDFSRVKICNSKDAAKFARQFYSDDLGIYESLFLITLNNANNTTGYVKISQGGITGTIVDTRIICKYALDNLSASVILVHNHPSGTLKPSRQDKDITNRVKKALSLFDIKVLDHIILTEETHYSFMDENLL